MNLVDSSNRKYSFQDSFQLCQLAIALATVCQVDLQGEKRWGNLITPITLIRHLSNYLQLLLKVIIIAEAKLPFPKLVDVKISEN